MKILAVHPGPLMYTKIYLRLEPLGLEYVAQAARNAGHEVRLIDLQVEPQRNYISLLREWHPDVIAFSCNYLPNVPEIVDLARLTKAQEPRRFIMVGGHSTSFVAKEILGHAGGAIDCVLRGEGEADIDQLLAAVEYDRSAVSHIPGAVTIDGEGPPPQRVHSLDQLFPARIWCVIGESTLSACWIPALPSSSRAAALGIALFAAPGPFTAGLDRTVSPERAVEDLARVEEPGIFIVDDVAFVQPAHGFAIGEAVAAKGIKKKYYLETRGDVLLRNKEVFQFWKKLGLEYMFLGIEAIDEEGLRQHRKRISLGKNFEALEFARSLGITVAINIIADPDWDRRRFEVVRARCLEIPEIVNISVNTPYPGTETWRTEARPITTRDYRLYDIQHAVLPTRLPLLEFYQELVKTQQILNQKHLGWTALKSTARIAAGHLLRGQTNFVKMLWKFNSVYNPELQMADHRRVPLYELDLPEPAQGTIDPKRLYILPSRGRQSRAFDDSTEQFVEATRTGTGT